MACSESDASSTTSSHSDGASTCSSTDVRATSSNVKMTSRQEHVGLMDLFGVQLEVTSRLLYAEQKKLDVLSRELGVHRTLDKRRPKSKEAEQLEVNIGRIQQQHDQLDREYREAAAGLLRNSRKLRRQSSRSQPAIGLKQTTKARPTIFGTLAKDQPVVDCRRIRSNPQVPPKNEDITVITAYINIGKFVKGEDGNKYTPKAYQDWSNIFRRIKNPLMVFVENNKYHDIFKEVRKELPANLTKIVQISRNQTWAFSLRPEIEKLFKLPYYPEIHPNTIIPDYSCIMHAKYEFVGRAVEENPFNTRYFAWLDVGLFRQIAKYPGKRFRIKLPPNFSPDKVAFSRVHHLLKVKQSAKAIVQRDLVSVSGSFFVGVGEVLRPWVQHYRNVTETMLRAGWISSDEQVLYYMAQHQKEFKAHANIQEYKPDDSVPRRYHLAYISSTVDMCEYNHTCLG